MQTIRYFTACITVTHAYTILYSYVQRIPIIMPNMQNYLPTYVCAISHFKSMLRMCAYHRLVVLNSRRLVSLTCDIQPLKNINKLICLWKTPCHHSQDLSLLA